MHTSTHGINSLRVIILKIDYNLSTIPQSTYSLMIKKITLLELCALIELLESSENEKLRRNVRRHFCLELAALYPHYLW